MPHILVIDLADKPRQDCWLKLGIQSAPISPARVRNLSNDPAFLNTPFDLVVICCTEDSPLPGYRRVGVGSVHSATQLAKSIRTLPAHLAMPDGKRWHSIPIILLLEPDLQEHLQDYIAKWVEGVDPIASHAENNYGGDAMKERVAEHRLTMLSELDDVGLAVEYEAGRYRISLALRTRKDLETRNYFGPADRRPGRLITVHRDTFGIQAEIDAFESLINRADLQECKLQNFFENHPHFLSVTQILMAQVRLGSGIDQTLIPDFILKPLSAWQRDSRWKVLELKLPQTKLLTGVGRRARLSAKVIHAIRQLRGYQEYLSDPAHEREVVSALGHPLKYPRLSVVIGRLANTDVSALEREQHYLRDVRIVTYDEIVAEQRSLLAV